MNDSREYSRFDYRVVYVGKSSDKETEELFNGLAKAGFRLKVIDAFQFATFERWLKEEEKQDGRN